MQLNGLILDFCIGQFEINILVELARVLNFTYTIENPPDGMCVMIIMWIIKTSLNMGKVLAKNWNHKFIALCLGKWGHVEADGTWSGLVRHAKDGIVDFVICDVFLTYSRSQVTLYSR